MERSESAAVTLAQAMPTVLGQSSRTSTPHRPGSGDHLAAPGHAEGLVVLCDARGPGTHPHAQAVTAHAQPACGGGHRTQGCEVRLKSRADFLLEERDQRAIQVQGQQVNVSIRKHCEGKGAGALVFTQARVQDQQATRQGFPVRKKEGGADGRLDAGGGDGWHTPGVAPGIGGHG